MEYKLPNQNQVAYNIIEFIKFNTRFIDQSNEDLVKSITEALSLTDGDIQARALVLFINAYNFLFDKEKNQDELNYFFENHKEFTVQVSSLCAKRDLQDDCQLNEKVIKKQEVPNDGELFIFLGAPLFMKGTRTYDIEGKLITDNLIEKLTELNEYTYIVGKVFGESYDLTD
jgi:hypothetical protein